MVVVSSVVVAVVVGGGGAGVGMCRYYASPTEAELDWPGCQVRSQVRRASPFAKLDQLTQRDYCCNCGVAF